MKKKVLLGIDLGTSACKVAAFDECGRFVALARELLITDSPGPGLAEQAVDGWWGATVRGLRKLLSRSELTGCTVLGVGVCGHWPSLALLNSAGEPLRPAILWKDTRGMFAPDLPATKLADLIGLPVSSMLSLPMAKLLWIRENEPHHLYPNHLAWCLGAKDTLVFYLTGRATTDPLEAWWTGLARPQGMRWDDSLLQHLGIPAACLAEIEPMTSLAGRVSASAAIATGLPQGTPVAVGTVDGVCGAVGAGVQSPGQGAVIQGTSLIVATPAPEALPLAGHEAIVRFPPLVEPYDLLYTSTLSGSADEFLEGLLGREELSRLREAALTLPPSPDGPLFIPHLEGITSPTVNPRLRGAWLSLASGHGWMELCRAVQEGIVFSVRQILEELAALGAPIRMVRLGGGGAQSRAVCQLYADVLDCPITLLQSSEYGCLGAAMLAAVTAGVYPELSSAMTAMGHDVDVVKPSGVSSFYANRYSRFCQACQWLGEWSNLSATHSR